MKTPSPCGRTLPTRARSRPPQSLPRPARASAAARPLAQAAGARPAVGAVVTPARPALLAFAASRPRLRSARWLLRSAFYKRTRSFCTPCHILGHPFRQPLPPLDSVYLQLTPMERMTSLSSFGPLTLKPPRSSACSSRRERRPGCVKGLQTAPGNLLRQADQSPRGGWRAAEAAG
jgi:hypothetical protein